MKPFLVLLGLVLAAGAGAVGGSMTASSKVSAAAAPLQAPTTAASPEVTAIPAEVQKRLDSLAMEVATLEHQLANLRADKERVPAAPAEAPATVAATAVSSDEFASQHREAILKVLADERADQERKREEERKQREAQQLENRADRVAQKVPMSDGQKRQLVEYYAAERAKFEEARTQMRDGTLEPGMENPREAFNQMREWRANELTRLFGTELGAQINEADTERMRGGLAGGGRRGNNGGNNAGANGAVDGGAAPTGGGNGAAGGGQGRARRNAAGG